MSAVAGPPGSAVAEDGMGAIGLLQRGDIARIERDVEGGDRLLEMARLGRANDRGRYPWPARDPGERDLRRLVAQAFRDLLHSHGDREIVGLEVHLLGIFVRLGPHGLAALAIRRPVPGEEAAR